MSLKSLVQKNIFADIIGFINADLVQKGIPIKTVIFGEKKI
jgi:hypothetical protein